MKLDKMVVGTYGVNCYFISCEDTNKTALVDPGGDANAILQNLKQNKLDLTYIILTHGHGDHIGAIPGVKEQIDVPVLIHKDDGEMLKDRLKNMSHLMGGPVEVEPDKYLSDGETLTLGNLELKVIHTPGHTRGSISIGVENALLTGDTLFANSIGRTDFEGGSFEQIIQSIKSKLLVTEESTIVYPGHGPASTIGKEKKSNPFLR